MTITSLSLSYDELLTAATGLKLLGPDKLPPKPAFALMKARRKITEAQADFDQRRLELVQRVGKRNEQDELIQIQAPDGTVQYEIAKEHIAEFTREFADMLQTVVVLEGVRPVSITELGDTMVSPDVLMACGPFITE